MKYINEVMSETKYYKHSIVNQQKHRNGSAWLVQGIFCIIHHYFNNHSYSADVLVFVFIVILSLLSKNRVRERGIELKYINKTISLNGRRQGLFRANIKIHDIGRSEGFLRRQNKNGSCLGVGYFSGNHAVLPHLTI
jgi:hypothetical protein